MSTNHQNKNKGTDHHNKDMGTDHHNKDMGTDHHNKDMGTNHHNKDINKDMGTDHHNKSNGTGHHNKDMGADHHNKSKGTGHHNKDKSTNHHSKNRQLSVNPGTLLLFAGLFIVLAAILLAVILPPLRQNQGLEEPPLLQSGEMMQIGDYRASPSREGSQSAAAAVPAATPSATPPPASTPSPTLTPTPTPTPSVAPKPVSLTVSAAGDCTLGTDEGFDSSESFNAAFYDHGYPGWFLENVSWYFENDNLTIVNFEGTLSERGEREDKTYAFRGDPSFAEVLTDGSVEAANLANNHSFDYGTEAYEDTKQALEDAGITSFGYDRSAIMEVNGIKVGLTGSLVFYVEDDTLDNVLEQINWCKEQGADLIISSLHWGEEGEYYPSDWQPGFAHEMIDAGADLVIGHHPHRLQPYEIYNGKVILYSLGNFCFGGNNMPSDMDSAIFRQTFTFEGGDLTDTLDYEIIPCSISSVSDYNNYQPTPVDGEAAERVLGKIYLMDS